jgi:hypothetical protein
MTSKIWDATIKTLGLKGFMGKHITIVEPIRIAILSSFQCEMIGPLRESIKILCIKHEANTNTFSEIPSFRSFTS